MDYEEYLEKFCTNKTLRKRTGDTHRLDLSLRTRLRVWLLERKGYLVRLEVDYHYHSVDPVKDVKGAKGFGFVRIHKYLPNAPAPAGVEIVEGSINE